MTLKTSNLPVKAPLDHILRPLLARAAIAPVATPVATRLSELPPARPRDADPKRVLPEAARERMRVIAADPREARAFLQRAGIIDDAGELTEQYR